MRFVFYLFVFSFIGCNDQQRSVDHYKEKKTLTKGDVRDIINEEYKLAMEGLAALRTNDSISPRKAWEIHERIIEWEDIRKKDGEHNLPRDREVLLNWTTTNEDGLRLISVERSINARDFEPIGSVNAKGNNAVENHYELTDRNLPLSGKLYYKLKLIDNDAKFRYSNIVMISFTKLNNNSLQLFPNPAKGYVQVSFDQEREGLAHFTISDALGRVVIRQQKMIHKGINSITLNDLGPLSPGVYFVTAMLPDRTLNSKLVIQ